MPTLTYMLELTEAELLHLWTLLELRTLNIGLETEETSMLEKVKRLMEAE